MPSLTKNVLHHHFKFTTQKKKLKNNMSNYHQSHTDSNPTGVKGKINVSTDKDGPDSNVENLLVSTHPFHVRKKKI